MAAIRTAMTPAGAGDHFARVADVADLVAHAGHGVAEVQLAPVVASEVAVLEREPDVAERQVGLGEGAHESARGLVGGRVVAGQREATHVGEGRLRAGRVPAARSARPQRVVVDLEPLDADVAEHHRAKASVADRQCLDPLRRGASVPQGRRRPRAAGAGEPGACASRVG